MTLNEMLEDIQAEIRLVTTDLGVGSYEFWGHVSLDRRPGVALHAEQITVEVESDPLDSLPFRLDLRHGTGPDAVRIDASLVKFDHGQATYALQIAD